MNEMLWLLRMGLVLWIAWKAIVLFDLENPLVAVLFSIVCMTAGPYLLEALADRIGGESETLTWMFSTPYIFWILPLPFALVGAYLWSCIEGVRIQARLEKSFKIEPARGNNQR